MKPFLLTAIVVSIIIICFVFIKIPGLQKQEDISSDQSKIKKKESLANSITDKQAPTDKFAFIGLWIQVTKSNGDKLEALDKYKIRISKEDLFYIVEENTSGKFTTYPGNTGRWEKVGYFLTSIEDRHYELEYVLDKAGYLKDGVGNYYKSIP